MNSGLTQKPDMKFWGLWNLSFGFFGVQIAYALQSANISRIFATLGADPHNLSYFWILPPLMGILVQPIVGTLSDKTWCRFGRRIPYLFIGAAMAVFVKMLVGDMVNGKQKALAYSIQSFLCNAGSIVGFVFPFFLTKIGIRNDAPRGVIPDSVIWAFYGGAAILILCVLYTTLKVKEWNPQDYARYNGETKVAQDEKEEESNWLTLLKKAPATFWRVGLVQFFCWAAFMYMWVYTNGAIADTCWGVDMQDAHASTSKAYQEAGNWVGMLYAVQAVGSVIWAMVLPQFKNRKLGYIVSLVLGAVGFSLVPFIHHPYVQFVSFLLIGCAWAAMLAMPFTFVTNALQGYGHMGAYLGLFNGTICVPQIIASLCGGGLLLLVGSNQTNMMFVAAVCLVLGALSVLTIKESK